MWQRYQTDVVKDWGEKRLLKALSSLLIQFFQSKDFKETLKSSEFL